MVAAAHGQGLHALPRQEGTAERDLALVRNHRPLLGEDFFIIEFDLNHFFIDLLIRRHGILQINSIVQERVRAALSAFRGLDEDHALAGELVLVGLARRLADHGAPVHVEHEFLGDIALVADEGVWIDAQGVGQVSLPA